MAPSKGNDKKLNENNSDGSGDPDPPNLWPKILPSPDLPCGGNVPVRRLQLRNKMQVLLVSTVPDAIYSPWTHTFPLLSSTFRSGTPTSLSKTFSEDSVLRLSENPLSCSGPGSVSFMEGNSVEQRCNFSIVVGSGATSDPKHIQGMAHFLEHIVHHGSAKYWEDDLLLNFLSKNDGHYNACTDREVTCYHSDFKYSLEALRLGLDMYADLLINPKVDIDFIQKEVHSIENELHLRRCHNFFRINQLVHNLAIPGDHPLKKFMCGSLATLFPSSRNAQELRNEILKFHKAHYRPDNMALVVQAPASLNVLQDFVLDTFGLISPSLNLNSQANSTKLTNPYSIKAFNKLITIKPGHRDNHTCEVIWTFPPEAWKNYKEKPMQYIAEVLSNNHSGGLRQFLMTKEWVLEMIAGTNPSGDSCNEYATMFSLTIYLTQKGRDELSDVLEAVFAYIRFVKEDGVKKAEFDKLKAASEVMFRTFPLGNSTDDSKTLAKHFLSNYEMKHLVTGNTLYFDYNPETIKEYFDELVPEKACFVLFTADTGKLKYMTEEWYGARYIVQDLEPQMLKKLNTGNRFTRHFSDERPTYPVNVETICEIDKTLSLEAPQLIQTSEQISMEYHPSRPIKTPQSMYVLHIISNFNPNLVRSKAPAFHVYSKMWQLKAEMKSTYIHQLELGTSVSIGFTQEVPCLSFRVIGLNKIATEVVKSLMDDFFDPNWDEKDEEKLFEISKEYLLHTYYASVTTTSSYAMNLFKRIKGIDHLTSVECYDELKRMTVQDIRNLIQQYKSKLCLHGSANGAVTEAQVIEICQHMEMKHFPRMSCLEISMMQHRDNSNEIKILELGERCLRMKSVLPNEKPFVLLNYYQMDAPDEESKKITTALARLIQDTVGYELRSKEQLGYVVHAFPVSDARNGICILVMANSDRHSICHIDNRIENCIKTFLEVKLTRKNLLPLISAGNIMRDPAYVQEIARKYLLDKGTTKSDCGYRKLSIQVCHENLHG